MKPSTELPPPSETTRLVDSHSRHGRCIEDQRDLPRESNRQSSNMCFSDSTKSVVFGGIDGLVSSLAVVAAVEGAGLSWKVSLAVAIAIVVSSALSVGITEFMSSKAHKEFLLAEKRRELWEFKHYKDGEILEMVNRFEARGMQRKDAEIVVNKMAQYENFFVGLMVAEELGLQIPEDDNDSALLTDAFVMFLSYACFGAVPLLAYLAVAAQLLDADVVFLVAISIALTLLAIFGMIKSSFCSSFWLYSALETIFLGLVSGCVAFSVGAAAMRLVNE